MKSVQDVNQVLHVEEPVVHSVKAVAELTGALLAEPACERETPEEPGLQELSIVGLVDLPESADKHSEVRRRILLTSLPNQLAYEFMLTDNDGTEIENVTSRLVDLCLADLNERKVRWVPRQPGDLNRRSTINDRVVMAICKRLSGLRDQRLRRRAILNGLQDRFRGLVEEIVAEIQDDVADYKRKVRNGTLPGAKKSPSLSFAFRSTANGNIRTLTDTIGIKTSRCALGTSSTWEEAFYFVNADRSAFVKAFGESVWSTLEVFLSVASDEKTNGLGPRRTEGLLTALLAKRGVSAQQARADKRKFREAMTEALDAFNPVVTEFVEKLRAGGRSIFDDLTFVNAKNPSP